MVRFNWTLAGIFLAFILAWAFILPIRLAIPPEVTFSSDASEYSGGAIHLSRSFFYSLDGVEPFFKREPGQSIWLAGIYIVFGEENRVAIFAMQALLYAAALYFFMTEASRLIGKHAGFLLLVFGLLFPSVLHAIFSPDRELLALVFALLGTTFMFRLHRTKSWSDALLAGACIGYLLITYSPFLLFPIWLLPVLFFLKIDWKKVLVFLIVAFIPMAIWGTRNHLQTGQACVTGCSRAAVAWHVRGEQAEHLRGVEPFMCLWAEYISRDWSERSDYCSFNAVKNRQWPEGPTGDAADVAVGAEGQQKILQYFPWYLWFSAFEIIELHVPFVNGWGQAYNVLVTMATVLLYLGVLCALPFLKRREFALLAAIPLYCIGIFILTDATPRYLLPVLFCYVFFAALGYDRLLSRIQSSWHR